MLASENERFNISTIKVQTFTSRGIVNNLFLLIYSPLREDS